MAAVCVAMSLAEGVRRLTIQTLPIEFRKVSASRD
jgi:hypothetical protein